MATRRVDMLSDTPTFRQTPQGGLSANAYLSRVGVFEYVQPDGSVLREARLPEEVFNPASLATLAGASLTVGHPDEVNPNNWQALTVGTVADDVRAEDGFIRATVRIQSAPVVAAVLADNLREFSCGYTVDWDPTPGTYEGQSYDGVQRNIRYNHVGMGPAGWGRAGRDVALRGDGASVWSDAGYHAGMTEAEKLAAEAAKAQARADATLEGLRADASKEKARADALQVELDAAKKAASPEAISALVEARLCVLDGARCVLGAEIDASKSDAELRALTVAKVFPSVKLDGKHPAYIEGLFDQAVERTRAERTAHADARTTIAGATTQPAAEDANPVAAARKRLIADSQSAWSK